MEYQTTHQETIVSGSSDSRYRLASVSRSNNNNTSKLFQQTTTCAIGGFLESATLDDQREDGNQARGGSGGGGGVWDDLTSSMHSIGEFIFEWKDQHCLTPCFVQSTTSMDSSSSARMEAPNLGGSPHNPPNYSLYGREQQQGQQAHTMLPPSPASPVQQSRTPIIQFPSMHLGDDDNSSFFGEDDDSDAFLQSRDNNGTGISTVQLQSIYRTPSSHVAAAAHQRGSPSNNNDFGLYRCPAWAAEEDEQTESGASSISADWEDTSPRNYNRKVIDVTDMEVLFDNCQL